MRSARMILATAAASAALALSAPGAYAAGGDWEHEDSSYSKEQDKKHDKEQNKEHEDSSYSKKEDKEEDKKHDNGSKHDAPRGGMHTGGGALTLLTADDSGTERESKHDSETYKKDSEKDSEKDKEKDKEKDSSWTKDGEEKESWKGEE